MWLMIEALDVFMFRDGKPFTSGEGHFANSLFPPSAFTIQGVLRSLYQSEMNISWDDWRDGAVDTVVFDAIGSHDNHHLGLFQMRGPYVARWNEERSTIERFFPLPSDVIQTEHGQLRVLHPSADILDASQSDLDTDIHLLNLELEHREPSEKLWLPESELVGEYLSFNEVSLNQCVVEADLFVREGRFGTALNYTHRTVRSDEGMLYAANFIRPQSHVGLLIELPDPSPMELLFNNVGAVHHMKIGGEGRAARFERIDSNMIVHSEVYNTSEGKPRKIVFLTPTYFANGWQPYSRSDWFKQHSVSAVVPRPLPLGGWDLVKRQPRSIHRFVQPGSVFYFDERAAQSWNIPNLWTEQPPDTLPLERLGFGEHFIGFWEMGAK